MTTDLTKVSDSAVVLAIAGSRPDALSEAYRRHGEAVLGLARRLLSDGALAEEVRQEVFLRLWNHADRFDPERGALRSYLLAQTHGRAVDVVRREIARCRREERDAERAVEPDYDLEREVQELLVAEHVRAALTELSDGERRAIELAYFGGFSYRQVAAILGECEGTVKGRIRSALRRLRPVLKHVELVER